VISGSLCLKNAHGCNNIRKNQEYGMLYATFLEWMFLLHSVISDCNYAVWGFYMTIGFNIGIIITKCSYGLWSLYFSTMYFITTVVY
jgi:hypothetical protein